MVTVAHLVEKIVREKPFLQEALSRGIVNNAALAEELRPQIEKELGKEVKFSAVNQAIRRLAEKLEKTFIAKAKFDKTSDITIKSDLIEITVFKTPEAQKYIKSIYDIIDYKKGDFLAITQSVNELAIITNARLEKKILKLFPNSIVKKVMKSLSSITINIPMEAVETVGLFYIVTRTLNWENINIVEIISTLTEMTFVINEDDTAKAFNALKKLIEVNS
jgi:aspartokinase